MTAKPTESSGPADPGFFFRHSDGRPGDGLGLDEATVQRIVDQALAGCDDGEMFLEYAQSESLGFDDGRLRNASFDTTQGFGLRAVSGEATGYAHASTLSEQAMARAAGSVIAVRSGHSGQLSVDPTGTNRHLYPADNPVAGAAFERKVTLMKDIDAYARGAEEKVRQASVSLSANWQAIEIIRPGGLRIRDVRPLVRLDVSIVVGHGERQESGHYGCGGRHGYDHLLDPACWREYVDEATRQALVNLNRSMRQPEKCRSCWAPAGPAYCSMKRSATGWRGISIARKPRLSPA